MSDNSGNMGGKQFDGADQKRVVKMEAGSISLKKRVINNRAKWLRKRKMELRKNKMAPKTELAKNRIEIGRNRDQASYFKKELEKYKTKCQLQLIELKSSKKEIYGLRVEITKLKELRDKKMHEDHLNLLPCELLLNIAQYLPLSDFNALTQTSRSLYGKLEGNRDTLPNAKCLVEIEITQEGNCLSLQTGVHKRSDLKDGYPSDHSKKEDEIDTIEPTEEENASDVVAFYGAAGKRLKVVNFKTGIVEGLARHLSHLLSKANIFRLMLNDVDATYLVEITKQMRKNRTFTTVLEFWTSNFFCAEHMNLLLASSPSTLFVTDTCRVPEDFYREPTVLRVKSIYCHSKTPLQEKDLFALSAANMVLPNTTLTFAGLHKFITEWSLGKRSIDSISLHIGSGVTSEREVEMLFTPLKNCCNLVDLKIGDNYSEVKISRRFDGAQIKYKRQDNFVNLDPPTTYFDYLTYIRGFAINHN